MPSDIPKKTAPESLEVNAFSELIHRFQGFQDAIVDVSRAASKAAASPVPAAHPMEETTFKQGFVRTDDTAKAAVEAIRLLVAAETSLLRSVASEDKPIAFLLCADITRLIQDFHETAGVSMEAGWIAPAKYVKPDDHWWPKFYDAGQLIVEKILLAKSAVKEGARPFVETPINSPEPPDGLHAGNQLVWGGRSQTIQPLLWRILKEMWHQDSIPIDELMGRVWTDGDAERIKDVTLRAKVSAINNTILLDLNGFPWRLSISTPNVLKVYHQ